MHRHARVHTRAQCIQLYYAAVARHIATYTAIHNPHSTTTFFGSVYQSAGARTKRHEARVSLDALNWGTKEEESFEVVKNALMHPCKLAHLDSEKILCLFTDASDAHCPQY